MVLFGILKRRRKLKKKKLNDAIVLKMWDKRKKKFVEKIRVGLTPPEQFEKETGKHAIWRGVVTKQYKKWVIEKYGNKND